MQKRILIYLFVVGIALAAIAFVALPTHLTNGIGPIMPPGIF